MMYKIFSIACALVLCAMPLSEGQQGLDSNADVVLSRDVMREDIHAAELFYEDTGESEEEWERGWMRALALRDAEEEKPFAFDYDDADWGDFDWDWEVI